MELCGPGKQLPETRLEGEVLTCRGTLQGLCWAVPQEAPPLHFAVETFITEAAEKASQVFIISNQGCFHLFLFYKDI